MVIEELLSEISVDEFFDRYYLKLPYVESGVPRDLLEASRELSPESTLAGPRKDFLAVRDGKEWTEPGPSSDTRPPAEAYRSGYTLVLLGADKHDRRLARAVRGFRKDFHGNVSARLAFIPPAACGLGWHYDAEEVFLLQLKGAVEFSLQRNVASPRLMGEGLNKAGPVRDESHPAVTRILNEGDWAYVPAGHWHKEVAAEDAVLLEIGVRAPSSIKIYDFLKEHLLKTFAWRRRLPVFGEPEPGAPGEVLSHFRRVR